MAAKVKPKADAPPACTYAIGAVVCGAKAVIRIDRGMYGERRLCRTHLNVPAFYEDVKENGWTWTGIR